MTIGETSLLVAKSADPEAAPPAAAKSPEMALDVATSAGPVRK